MVIDSFQKRFVTNTQLRQCFSRAKSCRLKKNRKSQILSGFYLFAKIAKVLKKARISKSDFKKVKLATVLLQPLTQRATDSKFL